jgi:hypothetical protein
MKVSEIHRQYSSYGRGTVRRGYFDESKILASARSALFDSPLCTARNVLTKAQYAFDSRYY